MAAPNLVLQDSSGTGPIGTITFSNVDPGTNSAAVAGRLLNDDSGGSVDTDFNPRVGVREIDAGTGEAVQRGKRAVDERWIQLRFLGTGSAGSTQRATGWQPVGRGRFLDGAPLAGGEYHDIEIRYSPASNAQPGQIEFLVDGESQSRLTAIEQGHTEAASPDGVLCGYGDGTVSEVWLGGPLLADSPADDSVTIPDLGWTHLGVPKTKLVHDIVIDTNDGSSNPVTPGNAYWAILSIGAGTTVTVTKGDQAAAPLDPATQPAAPDGEIILGTVERDDGNIEQSDITDIAEVARYHFSSDGLNITIGPGRGRVDNALLRSGVGTVLAAPASTTGQIVWLVAASDAQFELTSTGLPPAASPRAYKLWQFDTDGSGVVAGTVEDHREYVGTWHLSMFFRNLDTGSAEQACAGYNRVSYLQVVRGMTLVVTDLGSGNTQGTFAIDIERFDAATATWVDLYTSKGTDDRRLIWNWNDPAMIDVTLPEIIELDPHQVIRCTGILVQAFDGTIPSGLHVGLIAEGV